MAITNQTSGVYPVTIPSYDATADIESAFKFYHYGVNGTVPADGNNPTQTSVAYYLGYLQSQVTSLQNTNPTTTAITDSAVSLDTLIASGYYTINLSGGPATGKSYPTIYSPSGTVPIYTNGMLRVSTYTFSGVTYIYQTLQVYISTQTNMFDPNRVVVFNRSGAKVGTGTTTWDNATTNGNAGWVQVATTSGIALKQDKITLTASRVVVSDASGNPTSSSVTSATLGYLDIGSSLTTLLSGKADTALSNLGANVGTARTNLSMPVVYYSATTAQGVITQNKIVWVQQTQPTAGTATAGDLWFW